jgi:hypothetical protein
MISAYATTRLRRLVIVLWAVAGIGLVWLGWMLAFPPPPDNTPQVFEEPGTTQVVERPNGHAYQYIREPNLTWDAAKAAAENLTHKGQRGYLATMNTKAEMDFVMKALFPEPTDVVYLGGRQTAPNEWRWVTGPDAKEDGAKGRLFWTGAAKGNAPDSAFADESDATSSAPRPSRRVNGIAWYWYLVALLLLAGLTLGALGLR